MCVFVMRNRNLSDHELDTDSDIELNPKICLSTDDELEDMVQKKKPKTSDENTGPGDHVVLVESSDIAEK